MTATLLQPVSDRDLDAKLQDTATRVTRDSQLLATYAEWALNILIPANLDAGLLVVLGGPEARPMTPEEMDTYRLFFSQVADIARRWTEGNPPATGLVLPWLPAGTAPLGP